MTNIEQLVWYVDVFHASESKQAQCTGRGMYLDVNMTILPLLFPRQFFPGGRKRLFYCILDDKICEKLWAVDCMLHSVHWVSYLSRQDQVQDQTESCVQCAISCSVSYLYFVQRAPRDVDCKQCVSYLSPQVSLTVTGCVLRGIIAFTSRLAAPTVFFPLKKWSRELYGIKYELWPASQKGTEGRMVDTIKNFLTQLRKGKVWSDPYLLYSPGCSTHHVAH